MSKYNRVTKTYPDGTVLTKLYNYSIKYNEGEKVKQEGFNKERQVEIQDYVLQNECGSKTKADKERENKSRAVQKVYDYCKSNDFSLFITLTLDPKKCDSLNYNSAIKELAKFRKFLTTKGIKYVIVPEQHESGRWHFHGLVSGGLSLDQATTPQGKPIKDVFNIAEYKSGFSTATKIKSRERVNTYITKYITKEITVPKGKKRYWCSTGLSLPKEKKDYINFNSDEYFDIISECDYFKRVDNEYGTLYICEKQARS